MVDNTKVFICLRGTSSSGKSAFANYLAMLYDYNIKVPLDKGEAAICTADDYFTDKDGKYNFDPTYLAAAHEHCRNGFRAAIKHNVGLVIVANTSCSLWEFQDYIKEAEEAGYSIISLVLEKRHKNKNNHGLTEDMIKKQENKLRNSLKLS